LDSGAEVVMGVAQLPRTAGLGAALVIELTVIPVANEISGVATSVTLPGYTALLQSLLVGRRLADVESVFPQLAARLRGPLLRPTLAAFERALRHMPGHIGGAPGPP
jgi:hypothetical protein